MNKVRVEGPGWTPLTELSPSAKGPLMGALLTTFEPPDPGLLVEDYLPGWLGVKNGFSEEGEERLRYYAELENTLRRLKGRFAIYSSPGEAKVGIDGWIWAYIQRFEVGAQRAAVQHSKLWMFHRGPVSGGDRETLELVVSSANLTRSALRGQIQAGWRGLIPLEQEARRGKVGRLSGWGVLPAFLGELAHASGKQAESSMEYWLAILKRANNPKGVTFLASVPGQHNKKTLKASTTAWGLDGLKRQWTKSAGVRRLTALVPTVGTWGRKSEFSDWAKRAGVAPNNFSLAWIEEAHPWGGHWMLGSATNKTFEAIGIKWLKVPDPNHQWLSWKSPFCDEHHIADSRWSHSKLYELRQGNWRRLIVTSANLSRSAWGQPTGDGGLVIRNFELGVLIPAQRGFESRLGMLDVPRATGEEGGQRDAELPVAFLQAHWDGATIIIESRAGKGHVLHGGVDISLSAKARKKLAVTWSKKRPSLTKIKWTKEGGHPIMVTVRTTGGKTRKAAIHDAREGIEGFLSGGYETDQLQEVSDQLLLEQYGTRGTSIWEESSKRTAQAGGFANHGGGGAQGDYTVPIFADAREKFSVVDCWWAKKVEASIGEARNAILRDGQRLVTLWEKEAEEGNSAAKLAGDELRLRLGALQ